MHNTEYWNNEGSTKTFTHPLLPDWMRSMGKPSSALDAGCGYGRLTPELKAFGIDKIVGFDFSDALIKRAIRENPGAYYTRSPADLEGMFFDLFLCFALFTSCPITEEQQELISLINEHSRKHAYLYVSDYETADNPGYRERYAQNALNTYGCFKSSTAIFRHHESGHFDGLLKNWCKLDEKALKSRTMNGNDITIRQYLYQKA